MDNTVSPRWYSKYVPYSTVPYVLYVRQTSYFSTTVTVMVMMISVSVLLPAYSLPLTSGLTMPSPELPRISPYSTPRKISPCSNSSHIPKRAINSTLLPQWNAGDKSPPSPFPIISVLSYTYQGSNSSRASPRYLVYQ